MPTYHCSICGTEPDDQKSHHTKHIKTKKHKDAKRILELELEKMTDEERNEKHGKTDVAAIVASMETVVQQPDVQTITKKKISGEITWNVDDNKDSNENYAKIKAELQSLVTACHQILFNNGHIKGMDAQKDIMRVLCIKILQKQFNDQNSELWARCDELSKKLSDKQFQRFKNYSNCLSDITKTDNIEKDWKAFVKNFLMPLFPSIYYEDDMKFNCPVEAIMKLILKLDVIQVTNEFTDAFATSCGDIHEMFRNYAENKGKDKLGQYFTPRRFIHLIFYGIGFNILVKDNVDITIYDPCMGTGGFLTRLFNLRKIDSKNVYGCETDMNSIKFGEMSMVLTTGNTNTNIVKCDSLCENPFIQDTKVDCIVTNPPFGTSMKYDDLKAKFEKTFPNSVVAFEHIYPLKTNNGACLFVQHCVYMLREGGVCAVVLPDGELFEGNSQWSKKFRKWLCESVNIRTILKAPSGVFEHAGVKTNVVIFTKDGPTQSIRFLETNKECNEVRDMFSVTMDELVATKFSLDVGEYIEDVSENYDVPMVALGDVCDINGGTRIVKKECSSGIYPVYGSGEPTFNTNNSNRSGKNIIVGRFALSEKCVRIIEGDIYLNDSGLSIHNDNPVTFQYIGYYLLFNQSVIYNLSRGQAQRNLNMNKFKELKIPLPSLEVQQQIVDELTLVEESTTTIQTRVDQLKREKEQYRKYGKKAEIRALLEGSESKMLGDVCEIVKGDTNTKCITNTGEYQFYSASANNPTGTHNTFCFDGSEYILFIKSGGNGKNPFSYSHGIGKVYLVSGNVCANTEVVKLTINMSYNTKFIFNYLKERQLYIQKLAKYSANGNLGHIDMNKFKELKIPLPSLEIQEQCITLFEQKEAYIESIDKKIAEHKKYLEELKALAKDVITSFC